MRNIFKIKENIIFPYFKRFDFSQEHLIYSTILARVAVTGLWSLALLSPCSTPTTRHVARAAASRNT